MIEFKNVTKQFGPEDNALDNVNFQIQEGEFVSIVGKSGAGKTTLLRLLLREEYPSAGFVFFQGEDVHEIAANHVPLYRRKLGTVFQDYKLLHTRTAEENIAYVMEAMGASDEAIARDVEEVLSLVGLSHRASHYPAQLSGGEQQRVAIARALIHRPHVLIADEPTGNLDPYHTADIMKLLLKIHEFGTTVILATHNKEIINKLGRRVVTLEDGKIARDEERGKFII